MVDVNNEVTEARFPTLSRVGVMVFNATFNNISAISWWSILLAEETESPRENH
jgi:hypothetical protein